MTAATLPGPGIHDLSDAEYFAPDLSAVSLSSTGVRELLVAPAKFRHNQLNQRPPKRTFDVGHAAHLLVLGKGPGLIRIDADEWRSNKVKAEVQAVRDAGKVPLRPADFSAVYGMAEALLRHPHAPKLLRLGEPERTLIWTDPATGVLCRAKVDYLRADGIVDYKTCDSAELQALTRSVHGWGYYVQAAFYLRGFRALWPDVSPFFAFIAQEKDPPYLVQTFQLSDRALTYGDRKCAEALERYRDCVAADVWPGYPCDEIPEIDLPAWVRTEEY